ncbi:MAG: ABC transporter permease [Aigarchaeota archaeon]|nr:ABC transporter permease [Candidatus Pelearchaeum maunauluense]
MAFAAILIILACVLLIYIILPIAGVFFRVDIYNVAQSFSRPQLISALGLSIQTATIATFLAALTGVPLAYILARGSSRLSDIIRVLVALPLVFPPLIAGAALLNIYGLTSPIGQLARELGIQLTQSPIGIVLAQLFVSSPFVVLSAAAAFERIDKYYEYVSRTLGKSPGETFIRVTLPLAWRGIATGLILAWIRAMGEFGATVMMAYNPKTVSIQLWEDNAVGGLSMALPGVVVVILTILILLAAWAWISLGRQRESGSPLY